MKEKKKRTPRVEFKNCKTNGDIIDALAEELSGRYLAFFLAEQLLKKMCKFNDYHTIRIENAYRQTFSISETPGYLEHKKEMEAIHERVKKILAEDAESNR